MLIIRAVVIATVALISVLAGSAYGAKPVTETITNETQTVVLTDVCAFPVTVEATATGRFRLHFDKAGNVTAIQVQITEQDTFTAHGNTLVGEPYHAQSHLRIDAQGNIDEKLTGTIARVRLPDGSMFRSAGQVRVTNEPPGFALVPQRGHSGDVAAFCAALAA